MKKTKKILAGCICTLMVFVLYTYGTGSFDTKEDVEVEREEESGQEKTLYSDDFGIEYPAAPENVGVQVSVSENVKLPSDDSLWQLSVYVYHEAFGMNEAKKQEKHAGLLAGNILNDFFPGEQWNRTVVSDSYQDNYVYRIKGKEENAFQYTANKGEIDNSQLICEEGIITVPEPEDGNWEEAFQKYSEDMLEYFQVGLWDGENCHMACTDTKDTSETGGWYRYMIELDGIMSTKLTGVSFADNFQNWASFHYENKSLVLMFQMAQRILDEKRDCVSAYTDMEEAFEDLKNGIEIYYNGYANTLKKYYVVNISSVTLEYLDYNANNSNSFVPVLSACLQTGEYDISEKSWEWGEYGYLLQLETKESGLGWYHDSFYVWQSPMTDEI